MRKFIYGPGIDEPIAMIAASGANAGTYFYHQDALGSVVALSKFDSGAGYASFVEKYSYSAFGETVVCDGSGTPRSPNQSLYGNPYMFTGRDYESETGLYYYRARFYKPEIGRFLQTDPIGYADGLNWYAYCGNNPVGRLDPYGFDWLDNTSNFCAGMGDVISFGLTEKIRQWTSINDVVNQNSASYVGGEVAGFTHALLLGGGRVAYAGAAKVGSIIYREKAAIQLTEKAAMAVAENASAYRNLLKTIFRGGYAEYKMYTFADMQRKYKTAQAIISATGRTNTYLNTLGGIYGTYGVWGLYDIYESKGSANGKCKK